MRPSEIEVLHRLAEKYTAAWCSQSPTSVASFYEENGSLTVNDGEPAVGRQAISKVAESFMTDFPDMKVFMDDLVFENDEIRFHWTLTGTNDGPGGTGRRVKISGYEVWEVSPNNLIARSRGHFDAEDYRRQLGL